MQIQFIPSFAGPPGPVEACFVFLDLQHLATIATLLLDVWKIRRMAPMPVHSDTLHQRIVQIEGKSL